MIIFFTIIIGIMALVLGGVFAFMLTYAPLGKSCGDPEWWKYLDGSRKDK